MATVEDLQSKEHRDLLDVIDKLRAKGINRYVALPEIVVTGDQSAGKSSVLEAISGMSFPTKDNLCTRFATELVLRRSPTTGVTVSIIPAANRPLHEQEKLKGFHPKVVGDPPELSDVVEQAKVVMGIKHPTKAFSDDILRVELSGPEQPHLTMVDLPGLFQVGNSAQSDQDSETVTDMVIRYMDRPRSIILAVVSAKSDFALQKVTRLARQLDPNGHRTLGLITKPDTLDEGSESEAAYIRLAQNEDVRFKLGWHVLKNRNYKMSLQKATSEERNQAEAEFFSKGAWSALESSAVGVASLKPRLSNLLKDQILFQLPSLIKDVEKGIHKCKDSLKKLGTPRESASEQRQYLIHISHEFSALMKAALDGTYNDPFFGSSNTEQGLDRRLRAVVQNLLTDFKEVMNEKGCSRKIIDSDPDCDEDDDRMALSENEILRSDYIEEAGELISRNRGCELPGTFNPLIVGELFSDQCKPWEGLVMILRKKVLEAVNHVSLAVLQHVAVESTARKLGPCISSSIRDLGDGLKSSFTDLLEPYQKLHPITYNHALTENVQKVQAERRRRYVEAKLEEAYPSALYIDRELRISRQILLGLLTVDVETDMKLYGSALAVDYLEAYYNVCNANILHVDHLGLQYPRFH